MRRVPGAHDVDDAGGGVDLGFEHHRLLLLERDLDVDRRVRDRVLPLPARRRSRPVLRARPHARAVRDDELGPARGRARGGRDARLPASQGRLVGGAPGARGRGQGVPDAAGRPVRRRPLPREGARSGDPARVGRRRDVGRGEPARSRSLRALGLVGVLPLQRGPPRRLGQPVVPACERTTGPDLHEHAAGQPGVPGAVRRVGRGRVGRQGEARPRVPAMDARVPDPGAVPADEQGLLAAVQPVAAPMVRARLPPAGVVRGVRARGRGGVRHALLVVRPVPRSGRRGRRVAGGRVRARGGGARADPGGVRDRVDPRSARGPGARARDEDRPATAAVLT